MNLNEPLIGELTHEASNTRKMLERVPAEKLDWQPHGKSMSLRRLATHIALLPDWLVFILDAEELDLANRAYNPEVVNNTNRLLEIFDDCLSKGMASLQNTSNEQLVAKWKLRKGDYIIFELPRIAAVRSMVLNHTYHHRGQLSVYLRLLDVPVPGMYGQSADDVN